MCPPDYEGVAMGFPLSGVWTKSGKYEPTGDTFSLICTAGAIAKCVRMGYKPWKSDGNGTSLSDYLQACTFMMRADYCGDGTSHTRDGTYINNYDKKGIVEREVSERVREMTFEAAWGPNGAMCVQKVRIPELASLDDLVKWCPKRLKGKIGADCDKKEMLRSPYALMLNES